MKRSIRVVAAAICNSQDQILIACRNDQQAYAGQWEFPGGKIEPNEAPFDALKREIHEELGFTITHGDSLGSHLHSYPSVDVHLEVFFVRANPVHLTLVDHSEVRWLSIDQLRTWPLVPADLPFVDKIAKRLSGF